MGDGEKRQQLPTTFDRGPVNSGYGPMVICWFKNEKNSNSEMAYEI
jgi:hypothetical protein